MNPGTSGCQASSPKINELARKSRNQYPLPRGRKKTLGIYIYIYIYIFIFFGSTFLRCVSGLLKPKPRRLHTRPLKLIPFFGIPQNKENCEPEYHQPYQSTSTEGFSTAFALGFSKSFVLSSASFLIAAVTAGVLWDALGCSGVLWGALGCSGVLWGVLGCSGVLWVGSEVL